MSKRPLVKKDFWSQVRKFEVGICGGLIHSAQLLRRLLELIMNGVPANFVRWKAGKVGLTFQPHCKGRRRECNGNNQKLLKNCGFF